MEWLRIKYQQTRYNVEMRMQYQRDTIFDFFSCLKWWWKERPRKVKCDACGHPIWFYGQQDCPVYCNEQCAYYSAYIDTENDDDIPF